MSEVLTENAERVDFDALLGKLADNMRRYDELTKERDPAYDRVKSYSEALEDLDLEIPWDDQPIEVAYSSLKLLIAERKLAKLDSALRAADISKFEADELLHIGGLIGRQVAIETLDPEKHKLGTSRRNQHGLLDGLSRWHRVKQGKVVDIYLDSMTGAALQIQGRSDLIYQASPLIDRSNNYSPAFSIEPID